MNWILLIATSLAFVGFLINAIRTRTADNWIVIANWIIVISFGIQLIIMGNESLNFHQRPECDSKQLAALQDNTFRLPAKTGLGGQAKGLPDEDKIINRLEELSSLVNCLYERSK